MPITSKRSLKILLIPTLLLIFGNLPGRAASGEKVNYRELPFNNSLLQSIETTFCSKQQPSQKKILRYYDLIERRYGEVKQNLGSYYSQIKKHSKKKTKKKTKKKGEIKSYRILLKYIRQLQDLEDPVEFRLLAAKILHLDYALRINARKLATIEMLEKIPFSLRPKRIPLTAAPHGEASNLANPAGGFYSQKQLAALKARGEDISSLHPPKDSTFWVDHAISEIDVPRHYMTGQDPLHKGMEIIFPHQKAYFDKVRTTQSKPKLDIYIRRNGKKIRFKLKLGAEVYSETTCAALYTALGFSADITKYVSDFKVVLGDVDYLQFKRDWESYYSGYNPDKYIKEKGEDEEGHYIIFYEGVMEAKPDGLLRVGPWAYGTNGNGGRREVRGSLLFNMWVSNLDLKEAENNKLILRKIDGRTRFFNIQHDMGFAFGKTYMERPGSFMWDLVKKKTDEYVYMNFKGIVDNSLFHKVTFADARWMARLIARLSRRQITDAVDLGGWPKQVRGLLVEKLIARRNQLVTAFELEGEKTPEDETIGLMEFDRTLTTADGVVKNGNLKIYRFKNHPQYFGPRVNEFIAMILRGLRNTAVGSVVGVASSMRYLTLKPEWFDLDPKIVSKIILRMDRQIQRNPLPKSDKDSYLVQDTLMVGLRLGYGSILSGDVAYWRKYTMVTPVATADEGRFLNKFILNLLMPFNCRKKPASRERVLIIEDYIEGRGKVRYRTLGTFLEFNLTGSQVVLGRSFVGFKNSKEFQKVVYFRDRVRYHEGKFRIFLKFLGFFHSNPFYAYLQKGRLHRNTIEMSVPHSGVSGSKRQAIEKLLLEGDPSLLEKEGSRLTLEDNYFERKSYLKMLGLQNRSVYRVDSIRTTNMREKTEHVPTKTAVQSKAVGSTLSRKDTPSPRSGIWSPGAKKFRHYLQVESRKLNSWRFFDNGERYHSSVRLTAETDGHGAVLKPLLKLSLQVDDRSTHNKELRNGYVRFLNTVASDADFIAFDPSLHTVNRLWGYTQTFLDVEFYPEAIESLVNIKAENLWKTLAEVTGKPVEFWRKSSFVLRHPRRPVHFDTPEQYLARKARFLIRTLRKAGKCRSQSRRMEYVVKGLRKCVYKSGYTFEPVLLAVLLKLVDPADIYMRGVIKMPDNKELIFPAGVPLSNQKGKIRDNEFPAFHFIFDDPSEIYHVF